MEDSTVTLAPREAQIAELLVQGCDNAEMAAQLKMARRTVKAHLNRLFLRFGIRSGIKRVKLATLLYRRQLCSENNVTAIESQVNGKTGSSSWLLKGSRIGTSPAPLAQPNMSSRTTSASSTTSSDSGTGLNLRSGTKRGEPASLPDSEVSGDAAGASMEFAAIAEATLKNRRGTRRAAHA